MKKIIYTLLCLFAFSMLKAQTDNLMIVEYSDWESGTGVGVKIHNPTNQTIDLSEYTLATYNNGNTTPSTADDLSGNLASGASKIFGNSSFCGNCPNGCTTLSLNGVNGDDVVVLLKDITIIDMVGPLGADIYVSINGTNRALEEKKIIRDTDNCIRYFDLAGTTIHSWPNNSSTTVTNWQVFDPATCISSSPFTFQLPNFEIEADTVLCEGEELNLDYSSFGFNSYEWLGQNNNTASISITDSGSYTLRVQNNNFCGAQDEILVDFELCDSIIPDDSIISVIPLDNFYVPNIITPNGDKTNDYFVISGVDSNLVILNIFNRWGKKLYERIDYKNDWNANGLNDGTYYYNIIIDNTLEYKGWIEVKR